MSRCHGWSGCSVLLLIRESRGQVLVHLLIYLLEFNVSPLFFYTFNLLKTYVSNQSKVFKKLWELWSDCQLWNRITLVCLRSNIYQIWSHARCSFAKNQLRRGKAMPINSWVTNSVLVLVLFTCAFSDCTFFTVSSMLFPPCQGLEFFLMQLRLAMLCHFLSSNFLWKVLASSSTVS